MGKMRSYLWAPWTTKLWVLIIDSFLGGLCIYGAVQWRYDFLNRPLPNDIDITSAFIFALVVAIVWICTGVHKAIWRFTSLDDITNLFKSIFLVSLVVPLVLFLFFDRAADFPRTAIFIAAPLFFAVLTIVRMITVTIRNGDIRAMFRGKIKDRPNAVLVGSGASLHNYLRDITRKSGGPGFNIVGLIDTSETHKGRSIRGLPVMGGVADIRRVFERLTERYQSTPTMIATDTKTNKDQSYDLVRTASEISAPLVRVNPGLSDTLTPFETADLIGREVRALDIGPVKKFIEGKRVLISGAGGTIGSELTRQIAVLSPAKMMLVEASEHNLYQIDRALHAMMPSGREQFWEPLLGNIADEGRMREIIKTERPEIIIHAAAFKHVPMSEINPVETLITNVGGTKTLIDLATEFKADSFTLISTDKAVTPSNIMGASKRIAEMLTMATDGQETLSACAVRFGNVLASTGSVIPLFDEQIAKGGPVTVTHKDVNRYFMTTEEAATLVLQATALNANQKKQESSIYVLEMGEPVNIARLARQLIRLRGFVPDRDIKIIYTGLRPGEKITERLTGKAENLEATYVDGVLRFTGDVPDPSSVRKGIDALLKSATARDRGNVVKALAALLPNFKPNGGLK